MSEALALHLSARERIVHHLQEASRGIVDLRREVEVERVMQGLREAALVGAEQKMRTLTIEAIRARHPRHLLPGEMAGPPRALACGPAAEETPLDPVTQRSLRMMGLAPVARTESKQERGERLRLLRGILT